MICPLFQSYPQAYFRWNTTRNLQRQSNFYFAKEDTELREQLTREVALFPKALRSFLRGANDDEIFREEATKLVGPLVERFDIEPFSDFSAK